MSDNFTLTLLQTYFLHSHNLSVLLVSHFDIVRALKMILLFKLILDDIYL